MLQFQSQFIKTDVTAIKVFKNVTFIGIGATVHVYCNENHQLINKLTIEGTRGEQIFGIKPFSQNKILIFGGQFLLLFTTNQKYTFIEEIGRAAYKDWILEAKLIDNESKIATISMQNKLQIWDDNLKLLEIFECEERCILYSAYICYKRLEELVVLSGTVFNEVLIWRKVNKEKNNCIPVLKRLQKHEGVIFSIHYNEKNGLICSTSDDRSVILWKVENQDLSIELHKKIPNISPICQVYGHLSRVFRCLILSDSFITAGEDSVINIWTLEGKLIRKVETNQNSPIWALDYDKQKNVVLTGGGSGGVYAFSLNFKFSEEKVCLSTKEKPKLVGILASSNFVVFSENGILYVSSKGELTSINVFDDLKSYVLLKVSRCRRMVALAGFNGQIYIYKEWRETLQEIASFQSKNTSRIISLHWLTCDILLICQDEGKLTLLHLKPPDLLAVSSFILPASSQRCSTTATVFENSIVVGDRKGNIHRYEIGRTHPVQTISRVHSHLGVTNLVVNKNKLISLGRNSTIKTFLIQESVLTLITSDKVPYSWLLDVVEDFVIAFSGNNFVLWNYKTKRILIEKICGGGHRSWDFLKTDKTVTFVHIKDKFINKLDYDLDANKAYDLVESFHFKEINTMNIIQNHSHYILISGGEDTTLRITLTNKDLNSFNNLVTLKSHLSSIRCITTLKLATDDASHSYLIFSAGGRAQIVCWTLDYSLNDINGLVCRENHSYYEEIDSEESETRIMDLCATELQRKIVLYAACSDGYIKIFYVDNERFRLKLYRNIFYKLKCIFQIFNIRILDTDVLVTLASDGSIVFWNIDDLFSENDAQPFNSIEVHQSGVNTVSKIQLNSDSFLFLTGGDDNVVALTYLKFKIENKSLTVHLLDKYLNAGVHWAPITGTFINDQYFLTASVDQRLVLFKWGIKNECVVCETVAKYNSSVPDLKGLICFEDKDFDVFIYGLGVEFLKLVNK